MSGNGNGHGILPSEGADHLRALSEKLSGRRVGVVGDLVADVYVYGRPERISREAPVIIVACESEEVFPGGAGNTVQNLAALGAKVHAFGFLGNDESGRNLRALLAEKHGAKTEGVAESPRPTISKTRVLAGDRNTKKQQVLRLDKGSYGPCEPKAATAIARAIELAADDLDAIVVSDYGYGTATSEPVVAQLREFARTKPVVVDSRFALLDFKKMTIATPNEEEAGHAVGVEIGSLEEALAAGKKLHAKLDQRALLMTRGSQGMILFEHGAEPLAIPVAGTKDIVDVTGAGDTVSSVVALALATGAPCSDAAYLSNLAASVVVMKPGPQPCHPNELAKAIDKAEKRGRDRSRSR
ncbi:MAG: bifunctional heptose 7-phosphate kinase/heptose 1-phosphate adenyltransferase [Planctomycetota bacterium]